MTPIKRNYLYLIRSNGLLRARIVWNKIKYEISLGMHVDKMDSRGKIKWDGRRCKNNTTHGHDKLSASVINNTLSDFEDKLDKIFYEFEVSDRIPTLEEFKNKYYGITEEHQKNNLFVAFDEFLKEGQELEQWAENTVKKFRTIKRLLFKFNPKLKFSEINAHKMKELMAYQTSNSVMGKSKKEIEKGKAIVKYKGVYQNETINRNMRLIKWFLKWAYRKGYVDNLDFQSIKTNYKTAKKPVVFLEWDELMRILNLDLTKRPDLEKTRDMFCFCCFTSLRYSDLVNLRWGNITDDDITITTVKTTDSIVIDMNDYAKTILKKYHTEGVGASDKVFESKSSQKMNLRLKEIAKMCGINTPVTIVEMYGSVRKDITVPKYELISTHCGRRTFISNAISMGIPPNVVMKWTGHSDYKAMAPYIEIANESRKRAMEAFNKR